MFAYRNAAQEDLGAGFPEHARGEVGIWLVGFGTVLNSLEAYGLGFWRRTNLLVSRVWALRL